MTINVRNFQNAETQVVTANTSGAYASFTTSAGQKARDLRLVNEGTVATWVLPMAATGTPAPNSSSASGTQAYYLLPGEDVVIRKPMPSTLAPSSLLPVVGVTTDTGTAVIVIHAGKGS